MSAHQLLTNLLGYVLEQAKDIDPRGFNLASCKGFKKTSSDLHGIPGVDFDIKVEGDHTWLRVARLEAHPAPPWPRESNAKLDAIRGRLPSGYLLQLGGTVEDSGRGQASVAAGVPLFLITVLTLLMIQLKSFSRTFLVFVTAPLGLIGVTLFLLVFRVPFGFVAMLGTIALSGMIMRNSVILVDQIEQDIGAGHTPWEAVIGATVRRFRPIVLTALAAVLAMIPLSRSAFFGPMAVAIMGGLTVATVLTLLFLPALYAAWFKVQRPRVRPEHLGSDPWPGDEIEVAG